MGLWVRAMRSEAEQALVAARGYQVAAVCKLTRCLALCLRCASRLRSLTLLVRFAELCLLVLGV